VESRKQLVFLSLILAQAAHSIEEYVSKLYEVFAPARFVSSLFSQDPALGFAIFNAALVTFGLWCWAIPVRSGWRISRGLVWFWTILELGNGIGHVALALSRGGYFPGVATAPLLVLLALSQWEALIGSRKAAPLPSVSAREDERKSKTPSVSSESSNAVGQRPILAIYSPMALLMKLRTPSLRRAAIGRRPRRRP
jgi:hypothetical protein